MLVLITHTHRVPAVCLWGCQPPRYSLTLPHLASKATCLFMPLPPSMFSVHPNPALFRTQPEGQHPSRGLLWLPCPHAAFPLCSPSAWIPAPRTPRMRTSPIHLFPLLLFVTLSTSSREPQALWTGFQGKPGFAAPYLPGKEGPDAAPCLRFPLPGAARVAPEEPEGARGWEINKPRQFPRSLQLPQG